MNSLSLLWKHASKAKQNIPSGSSKKINSCVVENILIYRVFEFSETLTQKRYKDFFTEICSFAANFAVDESNQVNISREIMQCQGCGIVSKDINEK